MSSRARIPLGPVGVMMAGLTSAVLIGIICGGEARAAAGRPELVLRLKSSGAAVERSGRSASTSAATVRIKDIATAVDSTSELWGIVGELRLSLLPSGAVTRSAVERRLSRAGLPDGAFRVEGAPVCILEREGRAKP